jgi:hypothetical protein
VDHTLALGVPTHPMSSRRLLGISLASLIAHAAFAQAPVTRNPQPAAHNPPPGVGVWRGTSICLVRPSACRDEVVVYRIARVGTGDSLSFDARKIVNGQEEEMGVLACRGAEQLTCTMRNGTWRFTVKGDSLTGELRLPDNTKYRDVRTARSR